MKRAGDTCSRHLCPVVRDTRGHTAVAVQGGRHGGISRGMCEVLTMFDGERTARELSAGIADAC